MGIAQEGAGLAVSGMLKPTPASPKLFRKSLRFMNFLFCCTDQRKGKSYKRGVAFELYRFYNLIGETHVRSKKNASSSLLARSGSQRVKKNQTQ
jgi:hypothetical protein